MCPRSVLPQSGRKPDANRRAGEISEDPDSQFAAWMITATANAAVSYVIVR
jgi:hypothetical protein